MLDPHARLEFRNLSKVGNDPVATMDGRVYRANAGETVSVFGGVRTGEMHA